jgi:hypothetical protein
VLQAILVRALHPFEFSLCVFAADVASNSIGEETSRDKDDSAGGALVWIHCCRLWCFWLVRGGGYSVGGVQWFSAFDASRVVGELIEGRRGAVDEEYNRCDNCVVYSTNNMFLSQSKQQLGAINSWFA